MMKYLIGLGVLVLAVVAYFAFTPAAAPPEPEPAPAPTAAAPAAPEPAVAAPVADEDARLEQIAAETRENLPAAVTETLRWTDAVFLPRMRIMEFTYVGSGPGAAPSAAIFRETIATGSRQLCLDRRDMFDLGTTLRISLENSDGILIDRAYLLPADCQQFY